MTDGKHQSLDLADLLPFWLRALRAENKSPRTIDSYQLAATQLVDYLTENGHPTAAREVDRAAIQDFLSDLQVRSGRLEPSAVRQRPRRGRYPSVRGHRHETR